MEVEWYSAHEGAAISRHHCKQLQLYLCMLLCVFRGVMCVCACVRTVQQCVQTCILMLKIAHMTGLIQRSRRGIWVTAVIIYLSTFVEFMQLWTTAQQRHVRLVTKFFSFWYSSEHVCCTFRVIRWFCYKMTVFLGLFIHILVMRPFFQGIYYSISLYKHKDLHSDWEPHDLYQMVTKPMQITVKWSCIILNTQLL